MGAETIPSGRKIVAECRSWETNLFNEGKKWKEKKTMNRIWKMLKDAELFRATGLYTALAKSTCILHSSIAHHFVRWHNYFPLRWLLRSATWPDVFHESEFKRSYCQVRLCNCLRLSDVFLIHHSCSVSRNPNVILNCVWNCIKLGKSLLSFKADSAKLLLTRSEHSHATLIEC